MKGESRHDEYVALIDQIANLQREKIQVEEAQAKLQNRLRVLSARIQLEVGTAKDARGRPFYSNEQLRQAALTTKLEESSEYQQIRTEAAPLRSKLSELVVQLNRLIDLKYLLMVELGVPAQSEDEKYPIA